MAKKILIVCGEASGDLHAACLAKEILKFSTPTKILAVGGENLKRLQAVEVFYEIKGLSSIGLFDVLKKLPKFLSLKKIVLEKIEEEKPDLIVLVDFSGFNLRLARDINNRIPVIYYISPQVWASRTGRIRTIKKFVARMIVLFKFEEEFYRKHGVNVDFVGHPLLDIVKPTIGKIELLESLKLPESRTTIALLPGSRKQEITNILPVMLGASIRIMRKTPAQFIIAKSPQVDWEVYSRIIKKYKLEVKIVEGRTYDCLNAADLCLVASGTATLETAIMQKPFILVYRMNLLNYLLYRPQVRVPFIGIVNLVMQKKIIAEFIQFRATAGNIADEVMKTLTDPSRLNQIKQDLGSLRRLLGEEGACSRASRIIIDFLNK